jgi:RHS repeat-associated protein
MRPQASTIAGWISLFLSLGQGPHTFAAFPDKSGVKPTSISLPSGPGSIEGLGESFEPQLNTGTFTYRLPLKLPPVRGGAPELALEYNSGHGNGPLGFGWRLQLPHLQRQTDKGLPLYTDADTFVDWTGEELVRQADGSFRQENEFTFTRYERTPEGGWLARLRDGGRLWLGQGAASRLDWEAAGTFRWHLDASQDPNGNRVEYRYVAEAGHLYPEEIRYGLHATEPSQFFRVTFHYDETRPDPVVDFRPRFRSETRRRLVTVAVFLGDRPVRLWRLTYHTDAPVSLLASVTMFGDDRSRTDDTARANEDFLPPTFFDYSRSAVGEGSQMSTNELGFTVDFNAGEAELADVNFDGLPDILLDDESEGYMTALNRGGTNAWSPLRPVVNSPAGESTRLKAATSRLADWRGDGRTKLLLQDGPGFHFRDFASPTRFAEPVDFPQAGHFPLDDANVQFADLNFDKASDLLAADGDTLSFALAGGSGVIEVPTPGGRNIRFTDGWQLADMNGDRLVDLVLPGLADDGGTQVCLSRGFGAFEPAFAMTGGPRTGDLGPRGLGGVSLNDLNQDGLADLVYVDSGDVRVWLQGPGSRWTDPVVIRHGSIPDFDAPTTAIRFADMNGNGSTDVVWFETGSSSVRWLELNPHDKPWLLHRVTTTLGRSVEIAYRSSTDYVVAAAGTTNEWTSVAPFPVPVVAQIVEGDGLGNRYTNQFTYRNAYYDGAEREFRGFEQAVRRELGDASQGAPTLVTQFRFDTGAAVEALKGKPLEVEAMDDAGGLFHRETNAWTARVLPTVRASGETRANTFAFQRETATEIRERLPADQAVWLKEEFDYDDFGNQTRHTDWGRLDEGDPPWNDERVTVRTFSAAYPSGQSLWLLDRLVTEELQDEAGAVVTRKRQFYDDETFAGDNLGVVTKGNLTLVREWLAPANADPNEAARFRLAARNHYDSFGNIVASLDPLGEPGRPERGHQRKIEFDAALHTHPVRETIYTANPLVIAAGEPLPRLEMSADYDLGLGVLRAATDFNGNETRFDFDTFGRVTAITKPGDTPALPTSNFRYRLADPLADGQTVNWVETRQRENAGADGTFDSRSYFDGLGRKLMTRTESERVGEVVVNEATVFNQRRGAWKTLLPYFESGTLDFSAADLGHDFTETRYDALGRSVAVFQPSTTEDGRRAFTRTTYAPLSRLVEDEEQTRPGSTRVGAAMRHREDGLRDKEGKGRLRRVEEIVKLDDEGRPTAEPRAWVTTYRYDLLDNFTGYTDSQGNEKEFRYDALSRKTFMNDPDRGVMYWRYDDASNLVESRDAKEQVIRFTYDGANRLRTEDYLDQSLADITAGFVFDPARPLSPENRPDVAYFYDEPVTGLNIGNGTTATAQNTKGFLSHVWDLTGEEHTSYDARGRVAWVVKRLRDPRSTSGVGLRISDLVSYRTGFAYDSLDRLTRLTYPDDDFVFQEYNSRNLLERIHGGQVIAPLGTSNVIAGIAYRASAQPARINYGNGVETAYAYDPRLRLAKLETRNPKLETHLIHFAYVFDDASNIERIEDRRPLAVIPAGDPRRNTQHYRYDDLYRITEARYGLGSPDDLARDDGRIHYRYDRIGNMLEQTSTLEQFDRGVPVTNIGEMDSGGSAGRANRKGRAAGDSPGPHALTKIRSPKSEIRNFTYDANGNMLVIDGLTNTWDFKDRLIRVESADMVADYAYDFTDRRITKRVLSKQRTTNNEPRTTLYPDKFSEVRPGEAFTKYIWNGETRVTRLTTHLSPGPRVQRLRYARGWNLLASAVTAEPEANNQSPIFNSQSAFRWNSAGLNWLPLTATDILPAETVFWLRSDSEGTFPLVGKPTFTSDRTVNGPTFLAGGGFEPMPLTANLPAGLDAWVWDATSQTWRKRLDGPVTSVAADLPTLLGAGHALFTRADALVTLPGPDPALTLRFYHQDHLGSSSVLTDAAGNLVEETANHPFGHPRHQHQPRGLAEPYGFTQKERDGESGLHYFEARYLGGTIPSFVSLDPLVKDAQALKSKVHPYSYAESSPVRYIDPSGREPLEFSSQMTIVGIIADYVSLVAGYARTPAKSVLVSVFGTHAAHFGFAPGAAGNIATGVSLASTLTAAKLAGALTITATTASLAGAVSVAAGTSSLFYSLGSYLIRGKALEHGIGDWLYELHHPADLPVTKSLEGQTHTGREAPSLTPPNVRDPGTYVSGTPERVVPPEMNRKASGTTLIFGEDEGLTITGGK